MDSVSTDCQIATCNCHVYSIRCQSNETSEPFWSAESKEKARRGATQHYDSEKRKYNPNKEIYTYHVKTEFMLCLIRYSKGGKGGWGGGGSIFDLGLLCV